MSDGTKKDPQTMKVAGSTKIQIPNIGIKYVSPPSSKQSFGVKSTTKQN